MIKIRLDLLFYFCGAS